MQVHKCTKSIKKKRKEKQLVYTGAVLWLEWRIKLASREWFVLWAKWRSPRTAHVSSRSGSGSRQEGMRTTQTGGTPQFGRPPSKKATAIGGQRTARSVLNVIRLWPGRWARSMLPGRPWHRQLPTCTPSPLHHFLPSFRPHTNSRVTLSLACEHRICHGRCVRGFAVNSKRKCAG